MATANTSAAARSLWLGLGWLLRRPPRRFCRRLPVTSPARGGPALVRGEGGASRCVACYLCVAACPARCVAVRPTVDRAQLAAGDRCRGRRARAFEIDLSRCLECGLCVEACPEAALALRPRPVQPRDARIHPGAADRAGLRRDLEALLAPP
ncbi:MAG: 4Fe-4S binding protein [Gemmatimonadota bacterium]